MRGFATALVFALAFAAVAQLARTADAGVEAAVDPPSFVKPFVLKAAKPRVLAWSPDGDRLAVGEKSGAIQIFGTKKKAKALLRLAGHSAPVTTLAFSADGRWLASGAEDRSVRLWDVGSDASIRTWKGHRGSISHVAFDDEGSVWSVAPRDKALRWKRDGDAPVARIAVKTMDALALAIDPVRGRIAEGGDGTVRLTDIGVAEKWSTGFPDCKEDPTHLVCAIWRRREVEVPGAGGAPAKVKKVRGPGWEVRALHLSASGRWLVVGRDDGLVFLLGIDTGRPAGSLRRATGRILDVDLGVRDRVVAAGTVDGELWLWTWPYGRKAVTMLETGKGPTYAVAFSPDGDRLAVANADGTVQIGTVRDGAD